MQGSANPKTQCKLIYKTPKSLTGGTVTDKIMALKGYFITQSSAGNVVNVWNSTGAREGVRHVGGGSGADFSAGKGWQSRTNITGF